MQDIDNKGWNEWAKYVLKSIERSEVNISMLEDKLIGHREEMLKEVNKIREELRIKFDTFETALNVKLDAVIDQMNKDNIENKINMTKTKVINNILAFIGGSIITLIMTYLFTRIIGA